MKKTKLLTILKVGNLIPQMEEGQAEQILDSLLCIFPLAEKWEKVKAAYKAGLISDTEFDLKRQRFIVFLENEACFFSNLGVKMEFNVDDGIEVSLIFGEKRVRILA